MNEFELIVDILHSLNRRVGALEIDSEGGGYEDGAADRELIERLEKVIPKKT